MKRFTLLLAGLLCASGAFGITCAPGTLQSYINLAAAGCQLGATTVNNFALAPGANFATPINPAAIQVTPGGTLYMPSLLLTLNQSATAGQVFESIFRFNATGGLTGASVALNSPTATGDAADTGILDVCRNATFPGIAPLGCPTQPGEAIAFFLAQDSQLSDSVQFPVSSFFDVFVDLTVDAGVAGTASLNSATVTFAAVPEPSAALLLAAGIGVIAGLRVRRIRRFISWRKDMRVKNVQSLLALFAAVLLLAPPGFAANHREAPITSFDHKADITDVYAFRSYDPGAVPRVTLIMCVDPLQEPGNGPNWWPFDPDLLYEIKIDNNNDAVPDIVFQFRFQTEQRLPNLFQAYAGAGNGITAPPNSPPPVPPGTLIVPPQINSFNSPGLGTRQSYTVNMISGGVATPITGSGPFYVVPSNAGPRTINYQALFNAGTYSTNTPNVKVFAGTVDDPFWIDLGAAFDTLNLRSAVNGGVLTPVQDAANQNVASDTVSGYSVNAIALDVPVAMLTKTAAVEPATSTAATIGVWATTSRARVTTRRAPLPTATAGNWSQIQRMGNPLINELLVGTGFKDRFSMDRPTNDSQFANFFLDPALARIINAATGGAVAVPNPPRTDLLPLVIYAPPIAAAGTTAGPVADLLRLNTGVNPTLPGSPTFSRLGLLGGDPSGYPNGRRLQDDVVDISLRAVVGVFNPTFNVAPNNRLGDGVNVNDAPYRSAFPYLADAPSGRDRRHLDPNEPGCTAGAGAPCAP